MKKTVSMLLLVIGAGMLISSLQANAADAPPSGTPARALNTPKTYTDPYTGMEFVFVKGRCFQMGDTFGESPAEFKFTPHAVCVSDFWMGKYEVTQGEWVKVMGENPSHFLKCGEDCPVEQVSWDDTVTFMGRMRKNGGKSFRLPTEAEWEYAARSGGKKEKFAGGENLDELAWYADNSGKKTQPVGTKQSNGLGIYDMSGNVFEWCSDWFSPDYYSTSPKDNPKGPAQGPESFKLGEQEVKGGPFRVVRGGSWDRDAVYARAASRTLNQPGSRFHNLGFRLVFPPN